MFKVGEVVKVNKRLQTRRFPHRLKAGMVGVVVENETSVTNAKVKFFNGETSWVYSWYLSRVKKGK